MDIMAFRLLKSYFKKVLKIWKCPSLSSATHQTTHLAHLCKLKLVNNLTKWCISRQNDPKDPSTFSEISKMAYFVK